MTDLTTVAITPDTGRAGSRSMDVTNDDVPAEVSPPSMAVRLYADDAAREAGGWRDVND
jgi:hypothetical protein